MAQTMAGTYGVSLALVGLLTTALFVTHFAVQLPAGHAIDRIGARRAGLAAVTLVVAGNLVCLAGDAYGLAVAGRLLTGVGTGAGFVAGVDLVRAAGGSAFAQGLYGGSSTAGPGLALMIVPSLEPVLGWRAPYVSGLALALAVGAFLATRPAPHAAQHQGFDFALLRDRDLLAVGAVHAGTFGLSIVAGNWVVPLLEQEGVPSATAGLAGGLLLFAAVVSRPGTGFLVRARPARARPLVGWSVIACAAAGFVLALTPPLPVAALAATLWGLAAGVPFAPVFAAAQRLHPHAPAAAVAVANAVAVLLIMVATPLAGLAFDELPDGGAIAFAAFGTLTLFALPALRRAPL